MRWIIGLGLSLSMWMGTLSAQSTPQEQKAMNATKNPFFEPFQTPFGVPPFDKIKNEDYMPAFQRGLEEQRKEIEAIATQKDAPTFANTIEAMENSGQLLSTVAQVFQAVEGANTNASIQKTSQEVSPLLSAQSDNIFLDARLFKRVNAVYQEERQAQTDPRTSATPKENLPRLYSQRRRR